MTCARFACSAETTVITSQSPSSSSVLIAHAGIHHGHGTNELLSGVRVPHSNDHWVVL